MTTKIRRAEDTQSQPEADPRFSVEWINKMGNEGFSPYFAPNYFSNYYFSPLTFFGATDPTLGPTSNGYRDKDAFNAIVQALTDTAEFAEVVIRINLETGVHVAERSPLAIVSPDAWMESDESDPVVYVRQVSFSLTLVVRDEDPFARYDALDRLSCIAQNVIDGSDLGGGSLPALTKLRRGRYDPRSEHPEQSVDLHGEFSYLIPYFYGHDTSY